VGVYFACCKKNTDNATYASIMKMPFNINNTPRLRLFLLAIFLLCVAASVLIGAFLPVRKMRYAVDKTRLMTLTGYLADDPAYHIGGRNPNFQILLHTYPGIFFKNSDILLDATDRVSIKRDIKYHDTVEIKVMREEFEKYYIKRDSMNVWQKAATLRYDHFSFYSLRFRNKEYIRDLYETAKREKRENRQMNIGYAIVFFLLGLYFLNKRKQLD
jgi:hypothetical protein